MNILVTGGAGFIGTTLVPYLLARNHQVTVLDSLLYGAEGLLNVWSDPNLQVVVGDVRDQDLCKSLLEGKDAVAHLAAIVGAPACDKDVETALEVNHVASVRLAYDARLARVPLFLLASTASVYGAVPKGQVCTEQSGLVALSTYAQTKIDAEEGVLGAASLGYYLPLVLRFGTAYGLSGRMRFDTLINQFVLNAKVERQLVVYQPDAMRPYCHVRDIASAVHFVLSWGDAVMRRGIPHGDTPTIFNVGGHNRSKRDVAEWLKKEVKGLEVHYTERPDLDPRDYAVDFANSNLVKLGWAPAYCPEMGMGEILKAVHVGVFWDPMERRWRNV